MKDTLLEMKWKNMATKAMLTISTIGWPISMEDDDLIALGSRLKRLQQQTGQEPKETAVLLEAMAIMELKQTCPACDYF
ncbi:hypothetical protein [Pseudomonas sp. RL_105y_Pfl1_103]|uniref:hypothetical protein n=1 Tax=Pseudomonas sp. RL_105y_Pfl1_103 TaxID=3088707 RepID=UPI0030DD9A14